MKNATFLAALICFALCQPVKSADRTDAAACTACSQNFLQETNYCPSPALRMKSAKSLKSRLGKPAVLNLAATPIVLSCSRATVGL